jgi:hypothetical protein
MKLELRRKQCGSLTTLGELFINGEFFCFTLEDMDRKLEEGGEKVYGQTCIPRGNYEVLITWSNRFKRDLPLIKDVPRFEGIRFHAGNTKADTEGCILLGSSVAGNTVLNSRATVDKFIVRLEHGLQNGPVHLEIT